MASLLKRKPPLGTPLTGPEHGWSGKDLERSELVDDTYLENGMNGVGPMKAPSKVRAVANRLGLRTGGFHWDDMRRIVAMTGYPGVESWSRHNKGTMKGVWGVIAHHTGTSWAAAGDYPTLRVVRDGRAGLENSLSMFGLGKSGTIYLISPFVSWHAGAGNLNGVTDGNGLLAGIEAESDGGHWTPQQIDAYPRLVAAILVTIRENRRFTGRHADYALPRGRKTDFAGWPGGPAAFWGKVDHYLAHPDQISRHWRPGFPIIGAIKARYDQPWVGGRLGLPKGPEVPTWDRVGRWQEFAGGAMYWHPTTGAHPVWGGFYDYFKANGYENGLGYPVSGEFTSSVTGLITQGFQKGKLEWLPGARWTPIEPPRGVEIRATGPGSV